MTPLLKKIRSLVLSGDFDVEVIDSQTRPGVLVHVSYSSDRFQACAPGLTEDLAHFARESGEPPAILVELHFGSTDLTQPPFARVIRPRFNFHTGHVTIGGSLCSQIFTNSGWTGPKTSLSVLLMHIQLLFVDGGGRVDFGSMFNPLPFTPYTLMAAQDAFNRVANQHGWR